MGAGAGVAGDEDAGVAGVTSAGVVEASVGAAGAGSGAELAEGLAPLGTVMVAAGALAGTEAEFCAERRPRV